MSNNVPAWANLTPKDVKHITISPQLQTWYEGYIQVFKIVIFLRDLTIIYKGHKRFCFVCINFPSVIKIKILYL